MNLCPNNAQGPCSTEAPPADCTLDGVTVLHGDSRLFYSTDTHSNCASISQNRTCNNGTLSGSGVYSRANCSAPQSCTLDGVTVPHGQSRVFYLAEAHENCAGIGNTRTCSNGTLSGLTSAIYANCEYADPCTTGPIGTECTDGTVYAGETVGGARMFVARSDQPSVYQWQPSITLIPNGGSNTDGLANTDALAAIGIHLYPAAQTCRNRGANWYLPAIDELGILFLNRAQLAAANLPTSTNYYWSSTPAGGDDARYMRFSDGRNSGSPSRAQAHLVRCVRR